MAKHALMMVFSLRELLDKTKIDCKRCFKRSIALYFSFQSIDVFKKSPHFFLEIIRANVQKAQVVQKIRKSTNVCVRFSVHYTHVELGPS